MPTPSPAPRCLLGRPSQGLWVPRSHTQSNPVKEEWGDAHQGDRAQRDSLLQKVCSWRHSAPCQSRFQPCPRPHPRSRSPGPRSRPHVQQHQLPKAQSRAQSQRTSSWPPGPRAFGGDLSRQLALGALRPGPLLLPLRSLRPCVSQLPAKATSPQSNQSPGRKIHTVHLAGRGR